MDRPLVNTSELPWLHSAPLSPAVMREVRETLIFDCCKWDPQVGDTAVLCPTPLLLKPAAAHELNRLAEAMATEVLEAERAIAASPQALAQLGLPSALRRVLGRANPTTDNAGPRVMRFDFHATREGWRVSEVNSDVPGGYIEAKGFAETMAARLPGTRTAGDPVTALIAATPAGARIGLVHATAYTDDRQVMVYLARQLASEGRGARLLGPDQIRWRGQRAHTHDGEALDFILRFYPAEWLPNLGWFSGWKNFARCSTPQFNPPAALISQSKRFPLGCRRLGLRLPVWDALVPETRDPREIGDEPTAGWVLKPALGRVGDGIGLAGITPAKELAQITRAARKSPERWAAQRRFEALAWSTAEGPRFPCLGVYVVNGRAAGIYGRAAALPLIDAQAQDVAVLVSDPATTFPFSP